MPVTETETLYTSEVFDTVPEAESFKKGFESAMDYALEYCTDYTFRIEIEDKGNYVEVAVFKVWEE